MVFCRKGVCVLNTSTKTLREFSFFLFLGLNAFLSYKIYLQFYSSLSILGGGRSSFSFDMEMLQPLLIIFVVLTIVEAIIFLLLFRRFGGGTVLASSRLLNFKQVKAEQKRVRNKVFYTKRGGKFTKEKSALLLSKNIKLTTKKAFEHIAIFAPTGAGKTSSILIPQLQSIDNVSLVVTDPKGEIHEKTKADMKNKGYNVVHLNLYDANSSAAYNLLANCKSEDDVRKLSESILGSDEWGRLSQTLLQAFLFRAFKQGESLSDVVNALAEAPTNLDELEMEYFSDTNKHAILAFKQFSKTAQGEGFISSVFATVQARMKVFEFDNIRLLGERESFEIGRLREEKTILFVSYPEDESEVYAPFLSSFCYQVMNKLKSHESVNETLGNSYGLPIVFMLDEFANIGVIPEFDKFLATIRSKKMSVEIFLQSFGQLYKTYKDASSIILENCKTKITMSGVTDQTAELFAKLVGREQYKAVSVSSGDKSSSASESDQTKEVLSSDDIRRLKTYEMLIISDNLRPIKDDKNFYFYDKIQFVIYKYSPFSLEFNDFLIGKYSKLKKRR